ncbi:MAG: type II toxin-antitoxin system VapC family toxin [Moorea sp. SIO3I7]|uniref:type II toxin-antitoxin system VapC family toxin n=1 Tax=unclassified Moorena TaxID=2683338 RepID=UPI0013C0E5D7|nr:MULTISPECIES: type II toxin-antitoxin system VapC family toxin [unclassified Moorena]NEN99418.1 type II toxin-antitoxin system VapC family toxin [Moorena sp. SIO3I7]NEO05879.1 type II toxin-antitoxin system VapC family toxin [Moorena sp. SIO3I8]NEO18433.1 type II toxin-antitoxin system VapC family toxin [Moorena sp. SIO4A5]NEP21870.1 type II toxin-antitoxin system VapC family toxin [Moorena sp. SIO3I6]NEQ58494.1 type II toxin-antitoxin system VapC family toxin [Moorena sp. SIO4A1]
MSSFLLDTHALIWLSENDPNLPNKLRDMIDAADSVYLSIASLWEIAIKLNLGKLSLQRNYQTIESELQSSDITLLPIAFIDTLQISNLPLHHRDPFDRMLIAQAMNRSLVLISRDNKFDAYPIQRLWVS